MTEARNLLNSLPDIDLLALLAYGEARGEEPVGQLAVMHVALNRERKGGWFGKGLTGEGGVVLKPWQFSCFNENDRNLPKLLGAWGDSLGKYQEMRAIASLALSGFTIDPTQGATHYANLSLCNPDWAKKMTVTVRIGRHTFFK